MKTLLRPAISLFIILSVITGVIYPLITTGIGKIVFPDQTSGSLIKKNNVIVGSSLIGQQFSGANYFWGRPSATSPMPYNGLNSGGSNLSNSNPEQIKAVENRINALHDADPMNVQEIPIDLVTASGSGLDPHISPAAAYYQFNRVAKVRNMNPEKLEKLIKDHTETSQFGMFGEPRVNVLKLNLAMDNL
jgi:K+-transporting ATPase ATPase C chain